MKKEPAVEKLILLPEFLDKTGKYDIMKLYFSYLEWSGKNI